MFAHSDKLVLPRMTAPAARKRETTNASRGGWTPNRGQRSGGSPCGRSSRPSFIAVRGGGTKPPSNAAEPGYTHRFTNPLDANVQTLLLSRQCQPDSTHPARGNRRRVFAAAGG